MSKCLTENDINMTSKSSFWCHAWESSYTPSCKMTFPSPGQVHRNSGRGTWSGSTLFAFNTRISVKLTRQPINEPPHDKTNQMACAPSEDSDQPGYPPSLIKVFTVCMKKLGSLAIHWVHSEDSYQTGQMTRLIWVFAGRTVILLLLSWGGSNDITDLPTLQG